MLAERWKEIDRLLQAETEAAQARADASKHRADLAKTLALLASMKAGEVSLERVELLAEGYTVNPVIPEDVKPNDQGQLLASDILAARNGAEGVNNHD